MKIYTLPNRALLLSGACTGLAIVAMVFSGQAQARDSVTFSVSVGGPNVLVGASNAYPVYSQPRPVYVQPRPVYVQPAPVYYQSAPVYYQPRPVYYGAPPVYAVPQQVYYARPQGWQHGHFKKHHRYESYNQGYAPVYYQR